MKVRWPSWLWRQVKAYLSIDSWSRKGRGFESHSDHFFLLVSRTAFPCHCGIGVQKCDYIENCAKDCSLTNRHKPPFDLNATAGIMVARKMPGAHVILV